MGIGNELVGQTAGVMTEVYKDALSPSVKPVGTVLSLLPRTVRLAFGRWEKWVINGEEGLERAAEAVQRKAERIPEERLCEPEPYVAIPAIQQISYSYDSDELRDMYANLLANSMDKERSDLVHPSFVEVIKQLNPDEAKLLKSFRPSNTVLYPLIDIRLNEEGGGHRTIARNYGILGESICERPNCISQYLENLSRLGLIYIPDDLYLTDSSRYEPIEQSSYVLGVRDALSVEDRTRFDLAKKCCYLTNYGVSFMRNCVLDYDPSSNEE